MVANRIDKMLSRPGIYAVFNADAGSIFFCEVEIDGTCYQLKLNFPFEKDGVLVRDRWNEKADLHFCGPFARVPA